MQDLFIELVQVSLGTRNHLSRIPDGSEWGLLFVEAQRQAILGIITEGLERLPQEQFPPKGLLLRWIGLSQINENIYKLHAERAVALTELFNKSGIKSCVLKGIGLAQFYPTPSRRQCGDIDLWVDGKCKDVLKNLRCEYAVDHIYWHHLDAKIFNDVETEIHYHPCWMYNPFYNNRLQRWFEYEKDAQMVIDKGLGFAYPTVCFNAIYALVHLYHHLIEEGIGIRHIIDYYYILQALPKRDKSVVKENLNRIGLSRLAMAVMWTLEGVCGMSEEKLICDPDEKEGRFLLDEITRGGNFGHYRKDGRKRNSATRIFALLPHYPSEVLWVLPWKIWHNGWRVLHRPALIDLL